MNIQKLLLSCLFVITASAMQRPTRGGASGPEVVLKEIVSVYKNPVVVTAMNLVYDQKKQCFKESTFGETKKLVTVGRKDTTFYDRSRGIPLESHGEESCACLSIDDTVEKTNFTKVWLRKVHTADGDGSFEFPDIQDAKEEFYIAKDQRVQTIVTLKLCNQEALGRYDSELRKHIPFVEVTINSSECGNK